MKLAVKRYFSDLQIGETEVVGDFADHHLHRAAVLRDYVQFTGMLERATGIKLAYWHCDIAWRTDWRPDIAPLARAFRSRGIRFGAIIGGTPLDATDQAFVEAGLARLRELQANPATRLDDIVVQSWQPRPSKFLPETEPGTMTNLLLRAEGVGRQTASPPVPPKEASR